MKRITVTLPDDLARELETYLQRQQLLERDYQPAHRTIRITPAAQGSGVSDVSVEHDRYLAE